jgi:hypothetical protein
MLVITDVINFFVNLLPSVIALIVISIPLLKFFGEKWIQRTIDKDLDRYKSELSLNQTRNIMLHTKQYEIFPEVWKRLVISCNAIGSTLGQLREIPDLRNMNSEKISEWLEIQDFSADEVSYFESEPDKNIAYVRILDYRDIIRARVVFVEFHSFYMHNRVFIGSSIREELDKIDTLLIDCWTARKMDIDNRKVFGDVDFLIKAHEKYEKEIKPQLKEIEKVIHKEIFPASKS